MKWNEFADEQGLPLDFNKADNTEIKPYMSHNEYINGNNDPYVRLVTMSKDFKSAFDKLSDESKRRFIIGMYKNATKAQTESDLLTLESANGKILLITLVSFPNEHVLHVEQR